MVFITNNNNQYNKIAGNYISHMTCQDKHFKIIMSFSLTLTVR